MRDLLIVLAFLLMVVSPCLVGLIEGVHEGSDARREELAEREIELIDQAFIPG